MVFMRPAASTYFHTIPSILKRTHSSSIRGVLRDFHTIPSILKRDDYDYPIVEEMNFHTSPSILKPFISMWHCDIVTWFPYDSVYFKASAVHDGRGLVGWFPYDSVYFKAMEDHPIAPQMFPDPLFPYDSVYFKAPWLRLPNCGGDEFPYDSVYFKAPTQTYQSWGISIRFRLF